MNIHRVFPPKRSPAGGTRGDPYARTPDGQPLERDGVRVEPVRYRNTTGRFAQSLPVVGHRAWRQQADVYHPQSRHDPAGLQFKARRATVIILTPTDFRTEILPPVTPTVVRRPRSNGRRRSERRSHMAGAVIVAGTTRRTTAVVIGNPPIVDRATESLEAGRRRQTMPEPGPSTMSANQRGPSWGGCSTLSPTSSAICPHVWSWSGTVSDDAPGRARQRPESGSGWTSAGAAAGGRSPPWRTPMPAVPVRGFITTGIWIRTRSGATGLSFAGHRQRLPLMTGADVSPTPRWACSSTPRRPLPRSLHASASGLPIGRR